jgi:translation initiation factor 5
MSVGIPKSKEGEERYLRDLIITTNLNRFGGITRIDNIQKISDQTNIPKKMLISFYKSKLGCRVEENSEGLIFHKLLDEERLEEILEEFIEKNVLCPKCHNPEFDIIEIGKKKKELWVCKACGDRTREF